MIKLLICGDYYPNSRVADVIANGQGYTIFEEVKPYVQESDFSILNLEYPVVQNSEKTIVKCGPNLKGDEASVELISRIGFNVVTLANNHILDYGPEAMFNTEKICHKHNIKTVGIGKNIEDSSHPLVLEKEGKKVAIINCCEHEFSVATDEQAGANPLNPVKQFYTIQEAQKNVDYIVAIVHGGNEYYQLPSPRMKELYRFFIDAGADVVINHHQHCYSGYELYNGKPIIYGLGNFCFDSTNARNSIWNDGYMVTLHLDSKISFGIIPYIQCNEIPKISLMNDYKRKTFNIKIQEINDVINNNNELIRQFINWSESRRQTIGLTFSPWQNRITRKLASLGLLPMCLSKEKRLFMRAFLQCESHYDTLLQVFSKTPK